MKMELLFIYATLYADSFEMLFPGLQVLMACPYLSKD